MRRSTQGQTLVEIMVAIGVVVLLVTGLIVATTQSLRNSQSGRVHTLAVQRASEALELVRDLRNQSWNNFIVYDGTWCVDGAGVFTDSGGVGCPLNVDGRFTRTVTFTLDAPSQRMETTVLMTWSEGDVAKSTQIQTYFTNWK
jgi:Tfp pilus assembly protein PilV